MDYKNSVTNLLKKNRPKRKVYKINWDVLPLTRYNSDFYTEMYNKCLEEIIEKSKGTFKLCQIYELMDEKLEIIDGVLTLKEE